MIFQYLVLFGWSFAAATILPLSSEVPLAYLVHEHQLLALPVAIATFGNTLGACTTYWLFRAARRALAARHPPPPPPAAGPTSGQAETGRHPDGSTSSTPPGGAGERRQARALRMIQRWGAPALLLSWVPVLGDALVAAAGAARIPFAAASLFLAAGKLTRYLAIAWTTIAW